MANRTFYPSFSYGLGRVYLEFGFVCNGASNPSLSTVFGSSIAIASLAHTGGSQIITVGLTDAFPKVVAISADVTSATPGDWASIGTISNEGTTTPITFQIYYWVAAGTVKNDPPTTTTTRCFVAFRNTVMTTNGA